MLEGWGHSTWQEGVRLCEAAGARQLVAFHHDPDHDDDALDAIAAAMERRRPGSLVAREGLVIDALSAGPARWRRLRLGLRTLLGGRPGGFFIPYRHAAWWRLAPIRRSSHCSPRACPACGAGWSRIDTLRRPVCAGWTGRRRCRAGARTGSRASTRAALYAIVRSSAGRGGSSRSARATPPGSWRRRSPMAARLRDHLHRPGAARRSRPAAGRRCTAACSTAADAALRRPNSRPATSC